MADSPAPRDDGYVVLARRYRPQAFADVVGQSHVVKALSNAITSGRVAHAYLFTGARGVGKTSTARILAKCLNCEQGTSTEPCNQCDVCRSISVGEDVDVLEIDGASNRGIDEMRELRQNVGVRPSRSRYKVYIIDEVHMLTKEAFNALLKTLEEPPEHVKFIFCTTEAEKIPITILSRCQRFDFAGIKSTSIGERLKQIVESEGCQIDDDAVAALARRAGGSMRDSQSLLDQLLAFGGKQISAADVHSMLGTADDARVGELITAIVNRDPAAVLTSLDAAVEEGVDVGQLADQLLGYLRDAMVLAAGGPREGLIYSSPAEHDRVAECASGLGLETVLAAMQILGETKAKLRFSTQGRILVELALVRACRLHDLEQLPQLIAQLKGEAGSVAPRTTSTPANIRPPTPPRSAPASPAATPRPTAPESAAKKNEPEGTNPVEAPADPVALTPENASAVWKEVLASLEDIASEHASHYERLAIPAPNRLVVSFRAQYTFPKSYCERHARQFEKALAELTGSPIQVQFDLLAADPEAPGPEPAIEPVTPRRSAAELTEHPLVQKAAELFNARYLRHDEPEG